jgi:hypothetical protein
MPDLGDRRRLRGPAELVEGVPPAGAGRLAGSVRRDDGLGERPDSGRVINEAVELKDGDVRQRGTVERLGGDQPLDRDEFRNAGPSRGAEPFRLGARRQSAVHQIQPFGYRLLKLWAGEPAHPSLGRQLVNERVPHSAVEDAPRNPGLA